MFGHKGDNCWYQPNALQAISYFVSLHNNVKITYDVEFITHDIFS